MSELEKALDNVIQKSATTGKKFTRTPFGKYKYPFTGRYGTIYYAEPIKNVPTENKVKSSMSNWGQSIVNKIKQYDAGGQKDISIFVPKSRISSTKGKERLTKNEFDNFISRGAARGVQRKLDPNVLKEIAKQTGKTPQEIKALITKLKSKKFKDTAEKMRLDTSTESFKKNYITGDPIGKRLNWIAENGSKYDSPEKMIKGYEKEFGLKFSRGKENNIIGHPDDPLFGQGFKTDRNSTTKLIFLDRIDKLGDSQKSMLMTKNFSEEEIFKASIIRNNPKIKKQFLKLFDDIYENKGIYDEIGIDGIIERFKKKGGNNLLKDFDFIDTFNSPIEGSIQKYGGIHLGIVRNTLKDIGVDDVKMIAYQDIRTPFLGLEDILQQIKNKPFQQKFGISDSTAKKISEQFDNFKQGRGNAVSIVGKIDRELGGKKFNQIFGGVNFEHTLAKTFGQNYKYLPRNYLLKGKFTTRYFNDIKRDVFDLPLVKMLQVYEKNPSSKQANKIKNHIKKFNEATGNYADFDFNEKTGKLFYTDKKINYDLSRYSGSQGRNLVAQEIMDSVNISRSPAFQKYAKGTTTAIDKKLRLAKGKNAEQVIMRLGSQIEGAFNNKTYSIFGGVDPTEFNRLFPEVGNFVRKFGGDVGQLFKKFGETKMGRVFSAIGIPLEIGFIALDMQPGLRGDIEAVKRNFAESYGFIPGVSKAIDAKPFRQELAEATDDPRALTFLSQFEQQKKYNDLRNESIRLIEEIDQATQGGRLAPSGINLQKIERLRVIDNELRNINYTAGKQFDPDQGGIDAAKEGLKRMNIEQEAAQKQTILKGPRGGANPYYTNPLLDLPGQYQPNVYQNAVNEFGQDFVQDIRSELAEEQEKQERGLDYYRNPKNLPEIQKTILDRTYPARYGTFKEGGLAALDEYKDYDKS